MVKNVKERVLEEAKYMIKTKETIRSLANHFEISKSTVHNDLQKRLKEYDNNLYEQVCEVLETNLAERHIRGGKVTKDRYKKKKE